MSDLNELLSQAIAALRESRIDAAAPLLDAMLTQAPDHPQANAFRGAISLLQGDSGGALRHFEKAADAHADDPAFNQNYATALLNSGDAPAAEDRARRALAAQPDNIAVKLLLAHSLRAQSRDAEALPLLQQVVADQPNLSAINDLGLTLMELNRPGEAADAFARATEINPDAFAPWHNRGNAALDQHHPEDAIAAFDQAIRLMPDHAPSHVHRAQALLLSGRYKEGWEAYEARWTLPKRLTLREPLSTPLWDGAPFTGSLLVYAEQGYGDSLQFARFLPDAAEPGGTIILDVPPALHRLFASQGGGYEVTRQDAPTPAHDLRIPMMSLPRVLGKTLENLPAPTAYLDAPDDGGVWRSRLADTPGRKVGLAWQAFAERRGSAHRSVPLAALAPLFETPDIAWISLQKEMPRDGLPLPAGLRDVSRHLNDFADTAALIAQLDLVITVDTAVAHLAGALGRPVWVMLPHGGDWRWLMDRPDSPWYPSARLYRQDSTRDWATVAGAVARDLAGLNR
ncbi:MAG: tetratricopeptide repeat protein [Rhodospirillales bacterium]